ncbi:MAG: tRNA preQ1(34) S-adenosylmethionine ribosyltransferase-isomerase QueA [Fimbriimonadaceae bacterium]
MDYVLPEDRIAQTPLENRSSSKLLVTHRTGEIEHRQFGDVVYYLNEGDLLVLNDTRVTAWRLLGERETGGHVEFLLLHEEPGNVWLSMAKPGRRLKPGEVIKIARGALRLSILSNEAGGLKRIQVEGDNVERSLRMHGRVPLPPYIHQSLADSDRYQTTYAKTGGSAAAPTAGLHFTPEILDALRAKGVRTEFVTLDVSLDTFRPIQVSNLDEHVMHGETCRISEVTAKAISNAGGRIIAVGTTTVRTLETFASSRRRVEPGQTRSHLFIRPGYEFKVVDGMFTNFHLPQTTMLVMLEALIGKVGLERAYDAALANDYRFLSFGDSMLII